MTNKRIEHRQKMRTFENEQFGSIRVLEKDGEPWFIGRDVAEVLGYSNPRDAIAKHVDELDKGVANCDTLGGMQEMTIINESGLYSLIFSSKLPAAQQFKRWVTSEVLPAIRKTGGYMVDFERMFTDPEAIMTIAQNWQKDRLALEAAEKQIALDKPKVLFADAVSASDTTILIGELAKILKQNGINMGQQRLFEWMRENGYLMKTGSSRNLPTQKAMEMGLFEIKERTIVSSDDSVRITRTTKITGVGQQYFVNRFLNGRAVMTDD